jgi:hypothetical protein
MPGRLLTGIPQMTMGKREKYANRFYRDRDYRFIIINGGL